MEFVSTSTEELNAHLHQRVVEGRIPMETQPLGDSHGESRWRKAQILLSPGEVLPWLIC